MYIYIFVALKLFSYIQQCFYYEKSSFELSKFYSKQYKQENDRTDITIVFIIFNKKSYIRIYIHNFRQPFSAVAYRHRPQRHDLSHMVRV